MAGVRRFLLVGLSIPWFALAAAPQLTLPDIGGTPRQVGDYIGRGQWTVVTVWSVDCMICRRELPELAFFHEDHKRQGVTVLGISIDGLGQRHRVQAFIDEHALGFPNLVGERADIARFGAGDLRGTPTHFIYSPSGERVARHVGSLPIAELERLLAQARGQR